MPDIVFTTGSNEGIVKVTPFNSGDPIQTANRANCPATRTLAVDARDNSTYWIQKLADNNCWMLTNLAYGGGTPNGGANTYNDVINQGTGIPGSNSISNGTADNPPPATTVAKYYIPPGANRTVSPALPSTSTNGVGQYGYLYNLCAAMGSQDTAACTEVMSTPAPNPSISICPAGWRLPVGGYGATDSGTSEFFALNVAINNGSVESDAGLRNNGLFQRSGFRYDTFQEQGEDGYYWAFTDYIDNWGSGIYFENTRVNPWVGGDKGYGQAVRCVAE